MARMTCRGDGPLTAIGYSDPTKADTDGDGASDSDEFAIGTNVFARDSDLDGLSDQQEVILGTNPLVADTDDDGLNDGEEDRRRAEGFDPLIFDYRINSSFKFEVVKGFIAGDIIDIDTVPELLGQALSGFVVVGDIRDFVANLFKGEFLSAGFSALGLIPLGGDAARVGAKITSFVRRFPARAAEVLKYFDELFPSLNVARFIPTPPLKSNGAWLLGNFARGKALEAIVAPTIRGRALLSNYPVIDVFDFARGRAVSIKSIDLDARSYQSPRALQREVERQLEKLRQFNGAPEITTAAGEAIPEIAADAINSRELVLIVHRAPTGDFDAAIKAAAASKGIPVTITIVP